MKKIFLRPSAPDDLEAIQHIFQETILHVCRKDYSMPELQAWISGGESLQRWQEVLNNQFVLVAEEQKKITGFGSLDANGYIDFLYVHKEHLRQGIAGALYRALECEAFRQKKICLLANVSLTARPFFEKNGFSLLTEQRVVREGITLLNYKMEKIIFPDSGSKRTGDS